MCIRHQKCIAKWNKKYHCQHILHFLSFLLVTYPHRFIILYNAEAKAVILNYSGWL